MDGILDSFFNKSYENEVNSQLPEHGYQLFSNETEIYVKDIISIPICEFLKWIDGHFSSISLSAEDVVQYSKLEDAKEKVVKKLIENGDCGFTHMEIGRLIQDDGLERSSGAYVKYGENHAKVARYLGYVYSLDRYYYVSIFGYVSERLSAKENDDLFVRLFLRTSLFRTVYLLSHKGVVYMRDAFLEEYQIQQVIGFGTNEIDGYSNFVFSTGEGNVYTPESVNRAIKRIYEDYNKKETEKAKAEGREPLLLPHFSAHNLRHTFCTRLCENESNLKVIQSVMGHSDIQTTMDIYAECTQEKKDEVFANLNGKIMIR